jgi:hypothetical protein
MKYKIKINNLLLPILILILSAKSNAQQLVDVLKETISVNSISSMNGYSRNTAEIKFPKGTKGYIYRISVFNKGGVEVSNTLFEALKNIPVTEIKIGVTLTEHIIKNSDGQAVDFFIFTTDEDKDAFTQKKIRIGIVVKTFQTELIRVVLPMSV